MQSVKFRVEPNLDHDERLATDDSLEDVAGARHPINQPNTRCCLEGGECLTGVASVGGRAVPSQDPVVATCTSLKGIVRVGPSQNKPNTMSCLEGDEFPLYRTEEQCQTQIRNQTYHILFKLCTYLLHIMVEENGKHIKALLDVEHLAMPG